MFNLLTLLFSILELKLFKSYFHPIHDVTLIRGLFLLPNILYLTILPLLLISLISIRHIPQSVRLFSLIALSTMVTLLYQFYIFLLCYRFRGGYTFDWTFFWHHRENAFSTLYNTFGLSIWLFFLFSFLALLRFTSLVFTDFSRRFEESKPKTKKRFRLGLVVLMIVNVATLTVSPDRVQGELVSFLNKNLNGAQKIKTCYQKHYLGYLQQKIEQEPDISPDANSELLGKRIFFIHLESVNGFLVKPEITPELIHYSQYGIFFPRLYNNSIQTIRAQENILCGLPPSISQTIVQTLTPDQIRELDCLPSVLEQFGYKTLFFKCDNIKFARTDEFMTGLGFDELHYHDITQPNDPELRWGYREDVYFKRVIEYIEKNHPDEKLMTYIAVSATNHVPFTIQDGRYQENVPFPEPKNHMERQTNTTFIQDAYFGELMENLLANYGDDSFFVVFGDHAWPLGLHPGNIHNELMAYEENFAAPMLIIPPENQREKYRINTIVNKKYSQMDILPTINKLIGVTDSSLLGNPFTHELLVNEPEEKKAFKKIVTIQPYNGSFINVIDYPIKTQFDVMANKMLIYNLEKDPWEENPRTLIAEEFNCRLITEWFSENLD